MIAELREYLESKPKDAPSTKLVLRYLQALQKLFEEGFLLHERITYFQSPILEKMESGYKFFTVWLDSLLEQGTYLYCIMSIRAFKMYFDAEHCL